MNDVPSSDNKLDFKNLPARVLIVDDSPPDAHIVKHSVTRLELNGVEIFCAETVTEALEILEGRAIDICISDYHLSPTETSLDLLRAARHHGIKIPFVSVTGRTDEDSLAHELLSAGFDDVLHKDDVLDANLYRIIRNAWLRNQHTQTLEDRAGTDELTGLDNRRSMMRRIDVEFTRSKRINIPFSILYMDLNRFKQLNDQYGHAAGDAALIYFAKILRSVTRESDGLARLGGDEFGVILAQASPEVAAEKAASLSALIATTPLDWEGTAITLSVSYGVYSFSGKEDAGEALQRADQAMYAQKNNRAVGD